jgi:hypothetical protein
MKFFLRRKISSHEPHPRAFLMVAILNLSFEICFGCSPPALRGYQNLCTIPRMPPRDEIAYSLWAAEAAISAGTSAGFFASA